MAVICLICSYSGPRAQVMGPALVKNYDCEYFRRGKIFTCWTAVENWMYLKFDGPKIDDRKFPIYGNTELSMYLMCIHLP